MRDGVSEPKGLAIKCNSSNNYIMSDNYGSSILNYLNQYQFSNCSIQQLKSNLLINNG